MKPGYRPARCQAKGPSPVLATHAQKDPLTQWFGKACRRVVPKMNRACACASNHHAATGGGRSPE